MTSSESLELPNQDSLGQSKRAQAKFFKISSSFFALLGGVLLASNTEFSGYGFLFLSLSSGQLILASLQEKDRILLIYAASLFIFVDCMGVYRWLLS